MSILWCGNEDIDFPYSTSWGWSTDNTFYRPVSRGAFQIGGSIEYTLRSAPFLAGAVTSAWLSFYWYQSAADSNQPIAGLIDSVSSKGLFIGTSTSGKYGIFKSDGSFTQIADESGASLTPNLQKLDLQINNYGASGTINLFLNGSDTSIISYTGDTSIAGIANFDSIQFGSCGSSSGAPAFASEVIVADEDTRQFSLQTLALTEAGTITEWVNNNYTNINGAIFSDSNPTSSDAPSQQQQYNVTNPVAGTWGIKAVKISARAAASDGSLAIRFGYNNVGTTVYSSLRSPSTTYTLLETLDNTDPTNDGAAWEQSEMDTLQFSVLADVAPS